MAEKRKAYAPFSLITESGVANAPVEGYIEVDQMVQPTVSTGIINENGRWVGVKSSDEQFIGITKHVAVPNGGEVLSPSTDNIDHIDMAGFNDIFLAIKPTNGGNVQITACMGPDTNRFANLSPVNAGATLKGVTETNTSTFTNLLNDSSEALTADVWNIFFAGRQQLKGQKNMQIKIFNNSGGNSDIEFAFMRLV